MHLYNIFPTIIYVGSAVARGFTIPVGQPDGVYQVSYDAEGHALHSLLSGPLNETEVARLTTSDPEVGSKAAGPLLRGRQNDDLACGGYDLDHGNTDSAVEALKRQCNPGAIGGGLDFYSVAGSAVAYICNLGDLAITCQRDPISDSYSRITSHCGLYRAGWRTQNAPAFWFSTGYESTGSRFCGRGTKIAN